MTAPREWSARRHVLVGTATVAVLALVGCGGSTAGDPERFCGEVDANKETLTNPQLAQHKGHVTVQEVTADGVVVLGFGGGCHGCGMADVTLKQGIEKTLLERVPGVTAVRDATDHASGTAPYIARSSV